ncbi:MAG: hypothetical protein ACE141_07665 [Bryobacteraceae bacterium]
MKILPMLACLSWGYLWPQTTVEDYRVYTEHPRLFLQPRKLRMLKRERERQTPRWQQFDQLIKSKAQMAEPGFALALYSQVSGETDYCFEAVRSSQSAGTDVRQLALVFDWCQAALSPEASAEMAGRLERSATQAANGPGVAALRDRVLAAIALAGHRQAFSERELQDAIEKRWQGEIVASIEGHRDALPREETLALAEILHGVRDNLNVDLREPLTDYFRDLPALLLAGYYPRPYPAAENAYQIPAASGGGEPDLRRAALSRAGELSLVAYDSNTRESQFLQGWLMRDTFLMRGPLGVPYEFLWANPYLPGLSYHHAPLFFHDRWLGRLFVRSSWNEDATWLGYFGGELQVAGKDGVRIVTHQPASKPLRLGDVAVIAASGATVFRLDATDLWHVFLLGLRRGADYEVKVGDAKPARNAADPGGILHIPLEPEPSIEIRIRALK